MMSRTNDATQSSSTGLAVEELRRDNPDLLGALVVDGRGAIRAADATTTGVVEAAVALVVPARELLDRVAAELGCGAIKSFVLEGDRASMAFADIDGSSTAIVIGQNGSAPGALRSDALSLSERVGRRGGMAS